MLPIDATGSDAQTWSVSRSIIHANRIAQSRATELASRHDIAPLSPSRPRRGAFLSTRVESLTGTQFRLRQRLYCLINRLLFLFGASHVELLGGLVLLRQVDANFLLGRYLLEGRIHDGNEVHAAELAR